MGSLVCPSLILFLSLCFTLISPTHSLDCSSLKLSGGKKHYSNCAVLPTLNSTLHFTYNATNSSLDIAFSAPPPNANGWVAWAINPTGTGMAGSQALLALKNKGSLVVKTYNISSYSSIVEGKLSFEVWDLSAESGKDGSFVIYGSVKVPASEENLNQVWQVGPGVTSDGQPMKHDFAKANLGAMNQLQLAGKESSGSLSPAAAPSPTEGQAPPPQVGNNNSGDGWRVSGINAGLWILGAASMLVLM